jgi:hypothetical protein
MPTFCSESPSTRTQTVCRRCGDAFNIDRQHLAFLERISPIIGGRRHDVPPPTCCPMCRLQRRLANRNQLFIVTAPAFPDGEKIVSSFPGSTPFPVMESARWRSEEGWRPEDYGRPFDFTRPFFDQFRELRDAVPRAALSRVSTINSDYCNNSGSVKDCYLCFDIGESENCMHVETGHHLKDCLDCSNLVFSELCFDCVGCVRCYNLQSSSGCIDCRDSYFLRNCRSCRHCFGCVNLRWQEHCIFNQQCSREEYERMIASLDAQSVRRTHVLRADALEAAHPRPHMVGAQTENCTGNHIYNSRNIEESYWIEHAEDLRFCFHVDFAKDCRDYCIWGERSELIYESIACGRDSSNLRFCFNCWDAAHDLLYCDSCLGASSCFGCVGMLKRHHCIFNRHYAPAEYADLAGRIVEHMRRTEEWGEFFPMQVSAVPYNVSLAARYFPVTPADCASQGLRWYDHPQPDVSDAILADDLGDVLPPADRPLIVRSAASAGAFKVTVQEVQLLRRFGAPLPRSTYDERMNERAKRLGTLQLCPCRCEKSGEELLSVYAAPGVRIWNKERFEQEFT